VAQHEALAAPRAERRLELPAAGGRQAQTRPPARGAVVVSPTRWSSIRSSGAPRRRRSTRGRPRGWRPRTAAARSPRPARRGRQRPLALDAHDGQCAARRVAERAPVARVDGRRPGDRFGRRRRVRGERHRRESGRVLPPRRARSVARRGRRRRGAGDGSRRRARPAPDAARAVAPSPVSPPLRPRRVQRRAHPQVEPAIPTLEDARRVAGLGAGAQLRAIRRGQRPQHQLVHPQPLGAEGRGVQLVSAAAVAFSSASSAASAACCGSRRSSAASARRKPLHRRERPPLGGREPVSAAPTSTRSKTFDAPGPGFSGTALNASSCGKCLGSGPRAARSRAARRVPGPAARRGPRRASQVKSDSQRTPGRGRPSRGRGEPARRSRG